MDLGWLSMNRRTFLSTSPEEAMTREEKREHARLARKIWRGKKVTRAEAMRAHELARKHRIDRENKAHETA